MKYMIITKQHYQDLQKTILNKDQLIVKLANQIRKLETDNQVLKNIINPDIMNIDFPNSKKGDFEGEIDRPDNLSIWEL